MFETLFRWMLCISVALLAYTYFLVKILAPIFYGYGMFR